MQGLPKSKRMRKRYIVFEVKPELDNVIISRSELIGAIKYQLSKSGVKAANNGNFQTPPWLIILEDNFGLIRCAHIDKDRTIELLANIKQIRARVNSDVSKGAQTNGTARQKRNGDLINIEINTLGTTGTIKSAQKKYFNKYLRHNI
jgi:RNase P/RNase MRP subunit POP5